MDMLTDAQNQCLSNSVRVMQTIVGALAAGILSFFVVAIFVPVEAPPERPLLASLAIGATLVAIAAAWLVPSLIARNQVAQIANRGPRQLPTDELGDVGSLVGAYQTALIVRAAILEGVAFFNLVAFMIERQPMNLVAAGVVGFILLAQVPTLARLEDWVQSELLSVVQLREMRVSDGR